MGAVEEPPPAPENELRGLDIPYCLRIHMKEFPAKPRVMMKKQMMKFVYQVYWDKLAVDDIRRKDGMEPQPFGEALALFLSKKYGLQKLADHKIAEVVETCKLMVIFLTHHYGCLSSDSTDFPSSSQASTTATRTNTFGLLRLESSLDATRWPCTQ